MKQLFTFFLFLLFFSSGFANKFYSSVEGNMSRNGSMDSPWGSLQDVLNSNKIEYYTPQGADTTNLQIVNAGAPVKGGDTIVLLGGFHGRITITNMYNKKLIVIMGEVDWNTQLYTVTINGGMRWEINGMIIGPPPDEIAAISTVFVKVTPNTAPSYYIRIKKNNIYTVPDASRFTPGQWSAAIRYITGCNIRADRSEILDNRIRSVTEGLIVNGNNITISRNVIENFNGSGVRLQGSYCVFEYNKVRNSFIVADASRYLLYAAVSGQTPNSLFNGIIRNNSFISKEATMSNSMVRGSTDAVILDAGVNANWRIENNVVITGGMNGIVLYGGNNCAVINNTIVGIDDVNSGVPTVALLNGRGNIQPVNNLVANNIVNYPVKWLGTGTQTSNLDIYGMQKQSLFLNYQGYDLHLRVDASTAVNKGSSDLGIEIDHDDRPRDSYPDIGAFELDVTLPVTWGSFYASAGKDGKVQLQWRTIQEHGHTSFFVEHSTDGRKFSGISTLQASNSATGAHYSYLHTAPDKDKINYYRIKQMDRDGNASHTLIRAVSVSKENQRVVINGPNPVKNTLQLTILSKELLLIITDASGNAIQKRKLAAGVHALDLHQLRPGIYQLTGLDGNTKVFTDKFIKQ